MREEEKFYAMAELLDKESIYQLTEELVKDKKNKRVFKYSKVAAILLGILLGGGILNLESVQAAIQKMIYYIPGFVEVVEEKEQGYYILPDEIIRNKEDMTITVKAATKRGEMLNVRLDIVSEESESYLMQDIALLDKKTREVLNRKSHISQAILKKNKTLEWECTYEAVGDIDEFILRIGKMEIEFKLTPMDIDNYDSSNWKNAEDKGYKVSIIPLSDKVDKFAAVVKRSEDRRFRPNIESENGSITGTKVWDIKGNNYEIEDLYSQMIISGEYKVVGKLQGDISKIEVSKINWWVNLKKNTGSTIVLPNPKAGEKIEVNREFDIEGIPYTIRYVEGNTEDVVIGWQSDEMQDRKINQIDFDIKDGVSDGTSIYDEGLFEEVIRLENRNSKEIKLKVKNYGIIQEGNWSIKP